MTIEQMSKQGGHKVEKVIFMIVVIPLAALCFLGIGIAITILPFGLLLLLPSCGGIFGLFGLQRRLDREKWLTNKEYARVMLSQLIVGTLSACILFPGTFLLVFWGAFLIYDTMIARRQFLNQSS
jgi:hypothetical protein